MAGTLFSWNGASRAPDEWLTIGVVCGLVPLGSGGIMGLRKGAECRAVEEGAGGEKL